MSCQGVRKSLSEYLDQRLAGEEGARVAKHLARCRECATRLDELTGLRVGLQELPEVPVPERLRTQLLVLASRERARWNSTRTLPLTLRSWVQTIRFSIDNMMRPVALPFAGGVISALFLFGMLVPTLGFKPVGGKDVPIRLYTSAALVEVAPFGISNDETVVELYIDERGQAMDYSVQRGKLSPELQADLTKMMFFARFTPATWFGQPTNGKVLVSFRRVNYVVRG
jgi:hypothetical protein